MSYQSYKNQVKLLLTILPIVNKDNTLALHGGTAINLFHTNMHRLSIDIDLTYLPIENREISRKNINRSLSIIKQKIENTLFGLKVHHNKQDLKLVISNQEAHVKVEVNQINRGCYADTVRMPLCNKAQREFNSFCSMEVVEKGHLYGGKICAALDRQHPRDLFDIKYMFQTEGFTEIIKKGFIFYLISSKRPMVEILQPQFQDQRNVFENHFKGMTQTPFSYEEFEETRSKLVDVIHKSLSIGDKQFLLSIESGVPNWNYYDFEKFPAVQWKLINIKKLKMDNPQKHLNLVDNLQELFSRL